MYKDSRHSWKNDNSLEDTKVNIFVELHVSINPVPKLQKGLRRHFHPKTFQNGNCKVDDFSVLIAKSFFL